MTTASTDTKPSLFPKRVEPSRRDKALTGALHAIIAWPSFIVVLMLVGLIGLWGSTGMDSSTVLFMFMLFGGLAYGMVAWPAVVVLCAMFAALVPGRRAKKTAWILSAVCAVAFPFVVPHVMAALG
ncbi:hypothetical protein [Amycolatopsis sp. NPDC059657]|uniref:hypothetical protein n=1 Tax=Amycolatopsis sp. NPDC059657 TaxID=3346899 RepID=UPI003670E326